MTNTNGSEIRRVVTGHGSDKKSKLLLDGVADNARSPAPGLTATLLWCTDQMPADNRIGDDAEDMGGRVIGTPPPPNGTRFAVLEFAPGVRSQMHRTETVDYVAVLSGEIEIELDLETTTLRAGDVMVQRGTDHLWTNRGSVPARFAVVMVDAEPLGIGAPIPRTGSAQ